jgi:N-acyl-D-aspartate/D-glutamate deacylase
VLDLAITGGLVVDGTGTPRRRTDVGIRDGRIVQVGRLDEPVARQIDGDGLVVAPGFVDVHTHYDAQVSWDASLAPSVLHGVTTVIGGNCGFSMAPVDVGAADYVMHLLARVEGMPIRALEAGVPWTWSSFGEWLEHVEDAGLVVNAGFLVGHSTLRRTAMGPRAVGEAATPGDLSAMLGALRDSLAAGALGLSSSLALSHHDGDGNPVPSRFARPEELIALASAVGDHPGTILAFNPGVASFDDDAVALLAGMSGRAGPAGRLMNWNALLVDAARTDAVAAALDASDRVAAAGGAMVAQVVADPRRFYLSFSNGFLLDTLPGWAPLFGMAPPARMAVLADEDERRRLRAGAERPAYGDVLRGYTDWDGMTLVETGGVDAAGASLVGWTVGDVARATGRDPFDVLVDLVVADELRTVFTPPPVGDDDESWRLRARVWQDRRTVIGASDAGAHLDVASSFTYTTSVLCRRVLVLEEAVHQLTDVPRRVIGLRHRGRLHPGWWADLVCFDEATVRPGDVHIHQDLPGGARRLFAPAIGVEHVVVNGLEVVRSGQLTGERPGRVLRSGRDTETVGARA